MTDRVEFGEGDLTFRCKASGREVTLLGHVKNLSIRTTHGEPEDFYSGFERYKIHVDDTKFYLEGEFSLQDDIAYKIVTQTTPVSHTAKVVVESSDIKSIENAARACRAPKDALIAINKLEDMFQVTFEWEENSSE